MKIWIDISNAPHVRFFKDVIKYFENEGEDVLVTARKFGDIHKLMDMYDIDFVSVGKHGVTLEEKLKESAERVVNLADLISGEIWIMNMQWLPISLLFHYVARL